MLAATAFLVAILALLYLLGSVLFTVLMSALIAYVLLPLAQLLVSWMPWRESRPELSRSLAVTVIFVVAAGVTAGILAVIIPPTIHQTEDFIDEFPTFFAAARETIEGWVGEYSDRVPQQLRAQIEDYIASLSSVLAESAFQILPQTVGFIAGSVSLIIGLAAMPVLIFYFTERFQKDRHLSHFSITKSAKSIFFRHRSHRRQHFGRIYSRAVDPWLDSGCGSDHRTDGVRDPIRRSPRSSCRHL